ncbi:hypothetical protein J7J63_00680 [Candidatus Bipolaricaulota bacterium]|nr:hypothetical protein [Candidatus Bipolaricaulota bacterium]
MNVKRLSSFAIAAVFAMVVPLFSLFACPKFSAPIAVGTLQDGDITETSGIVASTLSAGTLWIHQDSGAKPTIYAITGNGEVIATCTLPSAQAVDWEDIARGTSSNGKSYLYIGDIGDNRFHRRDITVYRLPEPRISPGVDIAVDDVETFHLVYPDRPHDAETLLFDPTFDELYVITKWDSRSRMYRAKLEKPGMTTTLEYVGDLPFNGATGGDVSGDGESVVIRTYFAAYIWQRDPTRPLWKSLVEQQGCYVKLATEPQGEAICFTSEGDLMTVSEGKTPTIYRYTFLSP